MLAALLQLDLSLVDFLDNLRRAVPVSNLFIGLGKGFVFGFVIAVVACHFGLHVKPNTEKACSANTTDARGDGDHHRHSGRCDFRCLHPAYRGARYDCAVGSSNWMACA